MDVLEKSSITCIAYHFKNQINTNHMILSKFFLVNALNFPDLALCTL